MHVAIIGGGITGLSAAWELARTGTARVTLISQPPYGGLLRTERFDGCILECGADSWIRAKPWLRNLAVELGLAHDVIPCNEALRQTYILRGGELLPLPRGLRLVAPTEWVPIEESRLLSAETKARMRAETARQPEHHPDRSVAEFVRDHFGDEAVEYLAEPLFAGVYGGTPETLGVEGVLPKMVEYERRFGSLVTGARSEPAVEGPVFESMRYGLGQIPDALVEQLQGKVTFIPEMADAVVPGRVRVRGEWLEADHILLACGAPAAAALLGDLDPGPQLGAIAHSSATIYAFGFERDQVAAFAKGFGFLVPRRERRTVMAATWVTTKFLGRAPADKAIIRCFVTGDYSESLIAEVRADLARITGVEADPWFTRVFRWPDSMPQYGVGHAALMDAIVARLPRGMHLAGAYLNGVGMPDCVRLGATVAAGMV